MADYRTPGVYIEEISLLPPNIVRVATAVPAFIGYTAETELSPTESLINVPTKITSLLDYEAIFGGEATTSSTDGEVSLTFASDGSVDSVTLTPTYFLYPALRHFYANGGGDAYIVTVGAYGTTVGDAASVTAMSNGIDSLRMADEPTLLVIPDLANSGFDDTRRASVQVAALSHCNNMQDRFAILDVFDTGDADTDADNFRNAIGNQYLKYGAAYYPSLQTSIGTTNTLSVDSYVLGGTVTLLDAATAKNDVELLDYLNSTADVDVLTDDSLGGDTFAEVVAQIPPAPVVVGDIPNTNPGDAKAYLKTQYIDRAVELARWLYNMPAFDNADLEALREETIDPVAGTLKPLVVALYELDAGYGFLGAPETLALAGAFTAIGTFGAPATEFDSPDYDLDTIALMDGPDIDAAFAIRVNALYNTPAAASEAAAVFNAIPQVLAVVDALEAIFEDWNDVVDGRTFTPLLTTSSVIASMDKAIKETGYTLPPSAAMAGVYSAVDAARGVWKAPANVSLSAVSKVAKMGPSTLDELNMPTNGKAINAIRFFRGQGILVYGARTLAGNDNEWRYIPVRRTFLMVEESIKKATEPFVFEPNDANTWQKLRGMIEAFLTGLWRDGALAGAVPADAFYVSCGLGSTMTADDILNGKLIIEIGLAVVRPAEFIILRFSHKLQES